VTIGSNVVYSKIHDTGGMAGRGRTTKIPKRPYFRLAFVMSQFFIRKQLKNFLAEVFRG
jgi:phage gpG-like protein